MSAEDYTVALGVDPEGRRAVEEGLAAYNARFAGPRSRLDFQLYARDHAGEVVGGMFGFSGMDWLYVDYLWIAETARRGGLGGALLARAEDEARHRGCVGVFLYTYAFQAPDFYRKHGFEIFGTIEDCPVGSRRIYLLKRL